MRVCVAQLLPRLFLLVRLDVGLFLSGSQLSVVGCFVDCLRFMLLRLGFMGTVSETIQKMQPIQGGGTACGTATYRAQGITRERIFAIHCFATFASLVSLLQQGLGKVGMPWWFTAWRNLTSDRADWPKEVQTCCLPLNAMSSSREDRIRVPPISVVYSSRGPSPKKGKMALLGDLKWYSHKVCSP